MAAFSAAALVLFVASSPAATRLEDAEFNFSMTIPDGFTLARQVMDAKPDFIYAYQKPADGEGLRTTIIIERMHGTIGYEPVELRDGSPGFRGTMMKLPWHDLDVQAFEVPEEAGNLQIVNYNVQVPLKREAIQLRVVGPAARKAELLQLTQSLLNSLDGDSNLLHSSLPRSLALSPHYKAAYLVAVVLFLILGLAILWQLRRLSPAAMPAVAVAIYAASLMLGPGETREARGGIGALRLLGFLGLVLSCVDAVRRSRARRRARRAAASTASPGLPPSTSY